MVRQSKFWMLIVLGLASVGCGVNFGVNLPKKFPQGTYTRRQLLVPTEPDDPINVPPEIEDWIGEILFTYFGSPDSPEMPGFTDEQWQHTYAGGVLYREHCIHCHGIAGGGNGPTAPFLFPRPRDYRKGVFKWKSTAGKGKPTEADLANIIKEGAAGTSMPPFRLLPEQQLNDLVAYVKYLAIRGEMERELLKLYVLEGPDVANMEKEGESDDKIFEALSTFAKESQASVPEIFTSISDQWKEADENIVEPSAPRPIYPANSPQFEESVQRGKKLFLDQKAACYKCHGPDGQANPNDWAEAERKQMVDEWGNANYPRNLTLGLFRGGRRPVDIYRRVHQGIAGSSMPEGGKNLSPQEIWDLVNFVRTLPYRPTMLERPKAPVTAGHGEPASEGTHGAEAAH